jgi:hypothetical protein
LGITPDGTSAAIVGSTAATAIATGTWYHVAAVYNDTDNRIYVNGVLDSNGAENPKAYTAGVFASTSPFSVGSYLNSGAAASMFSGAVGELYIWNAALTAEQVAQLACRVKGIGQQIAPANLKLYLPLDEPMAAGINATVFNDYSGNNADVTGTDANASSLAVGETICGGMSQPY